MTGFLIILLLFVPPAPYLLYAIKQVELAVRAQLDERVKSAGVTVPQYTALTVLARRDGVTSAELARLSFVTPQSMGDLVTALARRGLITREADPGHGRRLLIRLSDTGRELLTELEPAVRRVERDMLRGLSGVERRQLRELLNRCRTSLAG